MNVVNADVMELVNKEYAAAVKDHGPLASMHEGYAVLMEEVEEARDAMDRVKSITGWLWGSVKENQIEDIKIYPAMIYENAVDMACEAIQVAAVCKRILDIGGKNEKE